MLHHPVQVLCGFDSDVVAKVQVFEPGQGCQQLEPLAQGEPQGWQPLMNASKNSKHWLQVKATEMLEFCNLGTN